MRDLSRQCQRALRRWLSQSEPLERADLIFVLAGHRSRKVFGAILFCAKWAPGVLMSTSDPTYIARVLNREMGASVIDEKDPTSPLQGHFFAHYDRHRWSVHPVSLGRLGTLSEMKALASWVRRDANIRSVVIVSAGIHLRRVRMCCQRLLPRHSVRLVAVSIDEASLVARHEQPEREGPTSLLVECGKVLLYGALLPFVSSEVEP